MDENVDGGVLTVVMHPQVIGRGHRIAMLERFIERCREGRRFVRADGRRRAAAVRGPAAIALVCLALAGCGSGNDDATPAPSPPPAQPSGPRPSPPGANGPPPAWLETERGSFWLGYSTFCWGGTCADYIAPSCDSEHVPKIAVRRGERVTAHLGFEPREVSLTFFPGGGRGPQLTARDPAWRVDRAGAFALFTTPKEGGDASYVGCLELD